MLIDIVILPPHKIRKLVGGKIRKATKGLGYYYIVDNTKMIPHLSLFHLRIHEKGILDLEKALKEILFKYGAFIVKFSEVYISRRNLKGIGVRFETSRVLRKLNSEVVNICSKYRNGDLFDWGKSRKLTPTERRYIKKYGTLWSVEKNFKPHFTLGRMRSQKLAQEAVLRFGQPNINFIADTVAICEIDHNGQVIKVIKEMKIG